MLSESDVEKITTIIVRSQAPLAVGIFGSYSVGTQRDGSDLDLFVIAATTLLPAARRKAVQRLLFGVLHPIDIHVFTPQEFEDGAYEYLSFPWVIARQAKLYYWSPDAAVHVPSLAERARPSKS